MDFPQNIDWETISLIYPARNMSKTNIPYSKVVSTNKTTYYDFNNNKK